MADPATGAAQSQDPGPGETTSTVPRLHVNSVGQTPTSLRKSVEPLAKSVIIVGGFDISQMYAEGIQTIATRLRLIT